VLGFGLVVVATIVLASGIPARPEEAVSTDPPVVDVDIDSGTLPPVEVDPEVLDVLGNVAPESVTVMLAENLAIERDAATSGDQRLLLVADSGVRLAEMERNIDLTVSDGIRVYTEYRFDTLSMRLMERDGSQIGAGIIVDATGTTTTVSAGATGEEFDRTEVTFDGAFVLRQGSDGRWLIADVIDG
jgi:hypothetical protein